MNDDGLLATRLTWQEIMLEHTVNVVVYKSYINENELYMILIYDEYTPLP